MSDQVPIAKAELRELKSTGEEEPSSKVTVQFNPETLKVSFSNQVVPPANTGGATDTRGTSATQFVGKGTTKLSVQLWFDVTSVQPSGGEAADVRELTKKVAFFITPKPAPEDPTKNVPPGVRFVWGSFQFDGIMEALEESLEFFSPEGIPLRASLTLSLSQQSIQFAFAQPASARPAGAGASGPGGGTPGVKPLTQAPSGASLQGLASAQGLGGNWQAIASANGIENPRLLDPGQLIDLSAAVKPPAVRIG